MFGWLWQRRGLAHKNPPAQIEYDAVYGLSRRALDDWFVMNPQLAAEHKILEKVARDRQRNTAAKTKVHAH